MKFSTKDFLSKFDQILSFLQILSNLTKKSLVEDFIFLCGALLGIKTSKASKNKTVMEKDIKFYLKTKTIMKLITCTKK